MVKWILFYNIFFISLISYTQELRPCEGKEFCLGYMNNTGLQNTPNTFQTLVISSRFNTDVKISVPNMNWNLNIYVFADSTFEINIPSNIVEEFIFFSVGNKGVFINSEEPISVVALNRTPYSYDATIVYPINYLGDEYYSIATETTIYGLNPPKSELLIVATEDNTKIHVGSNLVIDLNKGQTYLLKGNEVSGIRIIGDSTNGNCRPFALFTGAQSTATPVGCSAWDHTFEQILPIEYIGFNYYVSPINLANSYEYKIVATANNTQVNINNTQVITLNQSEIYVSSDSLDIVISSNKPIIVQQDLKGSDCSNDWGDPASCIINSKDKTINYAMFNSLVTNNIDTTFLNIVIESIYINDILFNDTLLNPNLFFKFQADTTMSYAIIPYNGDNNVIKSNHNFQAYLYGLSNGNWESYFYNLGWNLGNENYPDSSVCFLGDTLLLVADVESDSIWWSNGNQEILSNNDSLILTTPIESNFYTYNFIDSTNGCNQSYSISVISDYSNESVNIKSSHDSLCVGTNIDLSLITNINLNQCTIEWQPNYLFDSYNSIETKAHITESTWLYVTVTSDNSCFSYTDSIYIYVNDTSNLEFYDFSVFNAFYCADSTLINVNTYSLLIDDSFNDSIDNSIWQTFEGVEVANTCNSFQNKSLLFNGMTQRLIQTVPLNLINGSKISFYCKSSNGIFCDSTEYGDDLLIEYSIDNGITWTQLDILYESLNHFFNYHEIEIPNQAKSLNTILRFKQLNFDGIYQDVWSIDNFKIYTFNYNQSITWSPLTNIDLSNPYNVKVYPNENMWYNFQINLEACKIKDSILIEVENQDINIIQYPIECNDDSIKLLLFNFDTLQTADINWFQVSNNQNLFIGNDSSLIIKETPYEQLILASTVSTNGCITLDSIIIPPILKPKIIISGDNTLCIGDSLLLNCIFINYLSEDFNDTNLNYNLWETSSNILISDQYHSHTSQALILKPNSSIETVNLNTTFTDTISLFYGSSSTYQNIYNGSNMFSMKCSIDNGTNWDIIPFYTSQSTGFNFYKVYLPPYYRTTSTRFKWENNCCDTVIIDNIAIPVLSNDLSYNWEYPKNNLISSNDTINLLLDTTSYVFVTVFDSLNSCQNMDSILVKIGSTFETGLQDTVVCFFQDTLSISATLDTNFNYSYNWKNQIYPNILLFEESSDSIFNFYMNQPTEIVYCEIESSSGCSIFDTISITYPFGYNELIFFGDTAVCYGEEINLMATPASKVYPSPTINNLQTTSLAYIGYPCDALPEAINYNSLRTFTSGGQRKYSVGPVNYSLDINFIEFYFAYGNGNLSCDKPELGEEVVIQYSNDNGITWVNLDTIEILNNLYLKKMFYKCPDGVILNNSIIRWFQLNNSGDYEDVWTISNVELYNVSNTTDFIYNWSFPDISFTTTSDTVTFYLEPESTINVLLTDTNGCALYDSLNIVSDTLFSVDAGVDTTICSMLNFQLYGYTDASNYSAQWTNYSPLYAVNLSSYLQGYIVIEDSYELILSVNSQGCLKRDTVLIIDVDMQNPIIYYDTSVCTGDSLFITLDSNFNNVLWEPNNDVIQSNNTFIVLVDSISEYNLSFNDEFGCNYNDTIEFIINQPILMNLDSDTLICFNDSLIILPQLSNQNVSYLWSTGDTTEMILVNQEGEYWLQASNNCNSVTDTIIITTISAINLSLPLDTSLCSTDSLIILPQLSNQNISYLWNTGDTTETILVNQEGEYWLQASNNCETLTDSISINSLPQPNITIYDSSLYLISEEYNAQFYQWFDCINQENILGETNQYFSLNNNGAFSVIIQNEHGCIDTSDCIIIDYLSIENLKNKFFISPNPTNDFIYLKTNRNNESFSIIVTDYLGKEIYNFENIILNDILKIDLCPYSSGIYFITIIDKDNYILKNKIIKL